MMKTIIGFDTATNACTVALAYQGQILERFEMAPRAHTNLLLPMIDELLAEAGIAKTAVDYVSYGQGPGSFMGVRLATAVAQGLGYGWDRPVIPLSTMNVIAQTALLEHPNTIGKRVLVGWDARMNEVYLALCHLNEHGLMGLQGEQQLLAPDAVVIPDGVDALVGNVWHDMADYVVIDKVFPHARALVQLALGNEATAIDAMSAEPIYLRNHVAHKKARRD